MRVQGKDFYEITQMNKNLPMEERRFFAVQVLDTPGDRCEVYWETSYEVSKILHREDEAMRYHEKMFNKVITQVHMNEVAEAEADGNEVRAAFSMDVDERLMYEERMERLEVGLSNRKHGDFDVDAVSMYMDGKQRHCVTELSRKYALCTKTLYKYRQELDTYLRLFYAEEKSTM